MFYLDKLLGNEDDQKNLSDDARSHKKISDGRKLIQLGLKLVDEGHNELLSSQQKQVLQQVYFLNIVLQITVYSKY